MATDSTKTLLHETADALPKNASVEDAMERLLYLVKIERGAREVREGKTVSHADVGRRLGM